MERVLKEFIVRFEDGSEERISRVFVTQITDEGDSFSVRVFSDTEEQQDIMAFRLAMLNDLIDTGIIKAAADDGMLDDEITERAKIIGSRLDAKHSES